MNQLSELERVCNPIITCILNYWQLVNTGEAPAPDRFRADIEERFHLARQRAASSSSLARDFERIEKPLIFFVDYMIKEGNFPFRNEWNELARSFNELSGDEKFFDMLDADLNDPEAANTIVVYFIMLGLGFDGVYRARPEYIEKYLKVCRARFGETLDVRIEPLVTVKPRKRGLSFRKKSIFVKLGVVLVCVVFLAVSFAINFNTFVSITGSYKKALNQAVLDSVPTRGVMLYKIPTPVKGTDTAK
jgi:type VI protein secretion system component VasF